MYDPGGQGSYGQCLQLRRFFTVGLPLPVAGLAGQEAHLRLVELHPPPAHRHLQHSSYFR